MKYTLENMHIDGKYQWLWFRWFDLLHWLGLEIVLGDRLVITGFRINFNRMRVGSGSYLFAIAVRELQAGRGVIRVDDDGVVVYDNPNRAD